MKYFPGRVCVCGCGRPAEGRSIYHNEKCQQKVARQKARDRSPAPRCAEPGCQNARHARGKYCRVHCQHTGHVTKAARLEPRWKSELRAIHKPSKDVLIIDPICSPYRIPRREWNENAAAYREIGCKAVMDGQEVLL